MALRRRQAVDKWVGAQVAYLNFLECDCPRNPPKRGAYQVMPTSHSNGIVERLTRETRRFVAASGGEIPALGRGRARLAESRRSGPRWPYARSATKEGAVLATVAKDVEIERIALPPKAANAWRDARPRPDA